MKLTYTFFSVLIGYILFSGCSKLNPKIEVPSYIEINNYSILYNNLYSNGGPGTTNHKFTDVLVYANGKNLGMFSLPTKVPALNEGITEIQIKPVIKTNGVSSVKTDYPYMKFYTFKPNLKRGESYPVTPVFDYYPATNFKWVENFESSGVSLIGHTMSDSCGRRVSFEKFEGNSSFEIALNQNFENTFRSSGSYTLPNSPNNVFLELNYKAGQDFEVGVIGVPPGNGAATDIRSVGGINASAGWNKIYMFLTPAISTPPLYPSYFIYFYVRKNAELTNPRIYIDNIKLITQ